MSANDAYPLNLLGDGAAGRMRIAAYNCESHGATVTAAVLREDAAALAELIEALKNDAQAMAVAQGMDARTFDVWSSFLSSAARSALARLL